MLARTFWASRTPPVAAATPAQRSLSGPVDLTSSGSAVGTLVDGAALDSAALGRLLEPNNRELRARLLDLFRDEAVVFAPRYGETVATERARTWARIKRLGELGLFRNTVTATGDALSDARSRYDTVIGCVALLDHSLEVKLGVSLGLFGTTVRHMGTDEQRLRWLPGIETMSEFGCFCLTELGHGSNARGIETIATYDKASQSFIIHTPSESAQKYWIGGAAESATLSVVFAQLHVNGENHGIHAFVVRLRDKLYGPVRAGISVEDCGVKAGLNGVDNGRIWFDRVVVSRDCMLSRSSTVSVDGVYKSDIHSADARFGSAMAALTGGRVGIAVVAVNASKIGLAIAVRYAMTRRAFGPAPGAQEVPLMSYTSHQRRLMIPLATCYVYSFCAEELRELWYDAMSRGAVTKEAHVISAGFKALFTWFMGDALQNARECCGGQGYKSENRICVLRADRDVMLTFEGANDVMMQQVSKALLAHYAQTGEILGSANHDLEASKDGPAKRMGSGVTSKQFLRRKFLDRERKTMSALAKEMDHQTRVCKKLSFDAWNACLITADEAAKAHIERRIYDMHQGHIVRARNESAACAQAIQLCGELWALGRMDEDASFLRLGSLSVAEAGQVHTAVQVLCARVCSIAPALIDGFELPPHLLAPIAFDYVAHNARGKL